jgi:hypothetical protein
VTREPNPPLLNLENWLLAFEPLEESSLPHDRAVAANNIAAISSLNFTKIVGYKCKLLYVCKTFVSAFRSLLMKHIWQNNDLNVSETILIQSGIIFFIFLTSATNKCLIEIEAFNKRGNSCKDKFYCNHHYY